MESWTLREILEAYKDLTEEIYSLIDDNYASLEHKLNQRQRIIDCIKNEEIEKAHSIYLELGLDRLDEKVRNKMIQSLEQVKEELKEYRKTKMVNSTYFRNSKEKLNIFSKKV